MWALDNNTRPCHRSYPGHGVPLASLQTLPLLLTITIPVQLCKYTRDHDQPAPPHKNASLAARTAPHHPGEGVQAAVAQPPPIASCTEHAHHDTKTSSRLDIGYQLPKYMKQSHNARFRFIIFHHSSYETAHVVIRLGDTDANARCRNPSDAFCEHQAEPWMPNANQPSVTHAVDATCFLIFASRLRTSAHPLVQVGVGSCLYSR